MPQESEAVAAQAKEICEQGPSSWITMRVDFTLFDYNESGLKLDFQPFLCTHRVDTAALASFIEHFETL